MTSAKITDEAPSRGVGQLFVAAVKLTTASTALSQIISFGRSLVMARLLKPDDYGLFGLSVAVVSALAMLTNFSLPQTIIQRKFYTEEEKHQYLNTVWTLEIIRNALLTVMMLAAAYPATLYFRDPRVFSILLICAATPLLSGFTNIGMIAARKDIDFRIVVYHRQCSDVLTTVFAIAVAWATRSVWALVASQLFAAVLSSALSYWFHPYRPRLALDRTVMRESVHFGSHLFLAGVFTYITTEFDNLVVGRYLGMAALGAYGLAQRFAYMPVEVMTESLSSVLYPTYAKLDQEHPERLGEVFRLIFLSSATALTMLSAPMTLAAGGIIHLLYGQRWDAAVPVLAVLVWAGLFRGLARTLGPLMLAMHRPGVESKSKFVEGVVFIAAALYLVPRGGAAGVAWAGVLSYALAFILRYRVALVLFRDQRRNLIQDVIQVALLAAIAFGVARAIAQVSWVVAVLSFEVVFLALACLSMPMLRKQVVNVIGLIFRRPVLKVA